MSGSSDFLAEECLSMSKEIDMLKLNIKNLENLNAALRKNIELRDENQKLRIKLERLTSELMQLKEQLK